MNIYIKDSQGFDSWVKERKDINNNLVVPLYRDFCKRFGIKFHFGDEINDFDPNKHPSILHDEMPLHGKAMDLFNFFFNSLYHPFRDGLVSFRFTDWGGDFDYEYLTLDQIADEMEKKDIALNKNKSESNFYATVALISSLLLTVSITIMFTKSNILPILVTCVVFLLLIVIPQKIYSRKKRVEQENFDRKLTELKQELKAISIKYKTGLEDKKTITFLGEKLDSENYPILYKRAKENPETLKRTLLSLAKQPGGSIVNAMQSLESDLEHG